MLAPASGVPPAALGPHARPAQLRTLPDFAGESAGAMGDHDAHLFLRFRREELRAVKPCQLQVALYRHDSRDSQSTRHGGKQSTVHTAEFYTLPSVRCCEALQSTLPLAFHLARG